MSIRGFEVRMASGPRQVSEAVMQWMGVAGPALMKWNELATPFDTIYTDYVEV